MFVMHSKMMVSAGFSPFGRRSRRSGKDIVSLNLMIRAALRRRGAYYYIFPTYSQAKKTLWDGMLITGGKFLDFIPPELIIAQNSSEMKITLANGSIIQFVGSDNPHSLRGSNPLGCVFSEYAYQDPMAYQVIRPILLANNGFALFISTPFGRNSFYELYQIAQQSKDWFVEKLTLSETCHIPLEDLERDKSEGIISDDFIKQEFYCFPAGQEVLTSNGCKKIEDIVPNSMVVSHSGRLRKVLKTMSREYSGELIEITSYGSGEPILCTPEHPIRVYHQTTQSYVWKEAQNLTEEDRLVFPKMYFGKIKIISYELCMLLARYICDGSCGKNFVTFSVRESKAIIIAKYLTVLGIPFVPRPAGPIIHVLVHSIQLVDFFKSTCGLIANDKRIPFNLISGYEEEFFHELMAGDGCYNESKNYPHYCYTTVSKTLAYQVQLLANSLNLSYAAGISIREARDIVFPGERTYQCKKSYQINIPIVTRKKGYLLRAKNCIAADFKKITRIPYTGKVYNLSVQYDESYIVAGRAVHNCSFECGAENAIYAQYIQRMRLKGQISTVPYETGFPVHTAWDIGMRDMTSIIFFQAIGQVIRIIDTYEKNKEGLEHYAAVLRDKKYVYGQHIGPHDLKVRELGTGFSRLEKARELGIAFTLAPNLPIEDGIEAARSLCSKLWIDETHCIPLIKAMENYRYDKDAKGIISNKPCHDQWSHFADSLRYLAVSAGKLSSSMSEEDVERIHQQALYGGQPNTPWIFQDQNNQSHNRKPW